MYKKDGLIIKQSHCCDVSPDHGRLICHWDLLLASDGADINTVSAVNTGGNSSRWDRRGGKADALDVIFSWLSRSRRCIYFFCLITTRYFLLITKAGGCSIHSAGAELWMSSVRRLLKTGALHSVSILIWLFTLEDFTTTIANFLFCFFNQISAL